jgi:hypothetical protein
MLIKAKLLSELTLEGYNRGLFFVEVKIIYFSVNHKKSRTLKRYVEDIKYTVFLEAESVNHEAISYYISRPEITEYRIKQIQDIMENNPDWNRTKISREVCRLWGWQSPSGQLKDISCRDILRKLDKAGKIQLPTRQKPSRSKGGADKVRRLERDYTAVNAELMELRPLRVSIVSAGDELTQFKSLIDQYHYLGYDRSVGENMKYIIYDRDDAPLACLLFGSAAWSCRDRDEYIGWDKDERVLGLRLMTNNTRYLILPWINARYLASHVLSLISRRISSDWTLKYGHPIYCLETYVETRRFKGTCYKAANWVKVGTTTGRGRDGGHHDAILPVKDVYLYPLVTDLRELMVTRERRVDEV